MLLPILGHRPRRTIGGNFVRLVNKFLDSDYTHSLSYSVVFATDIPARLETAAYFFSMFQKTSPEGSGYAVDVLRYRHRAATSLAQKGGVGSSATRICAWRRPGPCAWPGRSRRSKALRRVFRGVGRPGASRTRYCRPYLGVDEGVGQRSSTTSTEADEVRKAFQLARLKRGDPCGRGGLTSVCQSIDCRVDLHAGLLHQAAHGDRRQVGQATLIPVDQQFDQCAVMAALLQELLGFGEVGVRTVLGAPKLLANGVSHMNIALHVL